MGSSPIPATRPVGQEAKTPPFHGGNRSSILLRVTNEKESIASAVLSFLLLTCIRQSSSRKLLAICQGTRDTDEQKRTGVSQYTENSNTLRLQHLWLLDGEIQSESQYGKAKKQYKRNGVSVRNGQKR